MDNITPHPVAVQPAPVMTDLTISDKSIPLATSRSPRSPPGADQVSKRSKPSTIKKAPLQTSGTRKPTIKYTFDNLRSLSQPSTSTDTFQAPPAPTESKPVGTYFDALKVKTKLTTDKGT